MWERFPTPALIKLILKGMPLPLRPPGKQLSECTILTALAPDVRSSTDEDGAVQPIQ